MDVFQTRRWSEPSSKPLPGSAMICLTQFRWEADIWYLWWSSRRTQGFAGPKMEGSFGWKQQGSTQMHLVVTVVRVSYISTEVGFLRPDVFTDLWLHGGVDRCWNNAFFSQRNLTFTLHHVWGWRNPFFSARCELQPTTPKDNPLVQLVSLRGTVNKGDFVHFSYAKNHMKKSMPASFFMPNFGMSWSGMGRFTGQSHGSVDTWARSTEGCTRCETKTFWWKEKEWQSLTEWQFLFNKKNRFFWKHLFFIGQLSLHEPRSRANTHQDNTHSYHSLFDHVHFRQGKCFCTNCLCEVLRRKYLPSLFWRQLSHWSACTITLYIKRGVRVSICASSKFNS